MQDSHPGGENDDYDKISGGLPSSRRRRRRGGRRGERRSWREEGGAIKVDGAVDGAKSVIKVESRRGHERRVSAKSPSSALFPHHCFFVSSIAALVQTLACPVERFIHVYIGLLVEGVSIAPSMGMPMSAQAM